MGATVAATGALRQFEICGDSADKRTRRKNSSAAKSSAGTMRPVPGRGERSVAGGVTPDFLQSGIPPAALAVLVIVLRVFLVVVLVILLGGVERPERRDLGRDRPFEPAGGSQPLLALRREPMLCLAAVEDRGPVLFASVAKLAVGRDRVDIVPEDVQQPFVGDLLGVVGDLNALGVAGEAGSHLLVRRVFLGTARVPGRDGDHAVELLEGALHAPEAAACERGTGRTLVLRGRRRAGRAGQENHGHCEKTGDQPANLAHAFGSLIRVDISRS